MKIKKFNEGVNDKDNVFYDHGVEVIEHYFVRQHMIVEGIVRKQGDGKEIPIDGEGIIREVKDWKDDIAYVVEFPITLQHQSPYGKKWKTDNNTFYIFHKGDARYIKKVY